MHRANVGRTRRYSYSQTFIFYLFIFFVVRRERERNGLSDRRRIARAADKLWGQHAIRATIQMMNYMRKGTNGNIHTHRERERETHPKLCSIIHVCRERTRMVGGGGPCRPTSTLASPSFGPVLILSSWHSPSSMDTYTLQSSRVYKLPSSLQEPSTPKHDAGARR